MRDHFGILVLPLLAGMLSGMSFVPTPTQTYVKSRVILTNGGNPISRKELDKALTAILQEANKLHEGKGSLDNVRKYCTESGFNALKDLVEKTGMFSTITEYRTHLLETATDQYEVRAIKVRVNLGETAGEPFQELVFLINSHLYIENVYFGLERHHYQRLIEEGRKLDDMIYRQQILDFLENFRTAHNRKNIDFLEKAYSDDALIIVGQVLQRKEGENDLLSKSSLGDSIVRFIKLSKREYIERLRNVFQLNSFVRVMFDSLNIVQHSKYPEIYGIYLKQRWNSSRYKDQGYLFVMMDFKDPKRPLILVRAWQPEKFKDGSVVSLGDFDPIF